MKSLHFSTRKQPLSLVALFVDLKPALTPSTSSLTETHQVSSPVTGNTLSTSGPGRGAALPPCSKGEGE